MTVRDMPLEAEAVKQRLLHHRRAHHRPNLRAQEREIKNERPDQAEFFNKIDVKRPLRIETVGRRSGTAA